MKVALYGRQANELKKSMERLKNMFEAQERYNSIDYYLELDSLRGNLLEYDVVMLSKSVMEELEHYLDKPEGKMVTLSLGKRIETINVDEILYVEANLKKVHLWKRQGDVILPISISEIEKTLEKEGFIKTHRSFLVNKTHIRGIAKNAVMLDNEIQIPISKYRVQEVKERYLNLMRDE